MTRLKLLSLLLAACGSVVADDPVTMVGKTAPAPIFTTLSGEYQRVSKLYGSDAGGGQTEKSAVALSFMSLNCVPCKKEMPLFLEAVRSFSGQPGSGNKAFRFFFISLDPLSAKDKVREFVVGQGVDPSKELLLDPYQRAAKMFGVSTIPRTFVIAPDGTVTDDISGAPEDYGARLKVGIEKALKQ